MFNARPAFQSRVVPVIIIDDVQHAVPMATALLEGGIDVVEITLRTEAALGAIEAVAKALPEMHTGAGTVVRPDQVQSVIDAGASFALSPGYTPALIDAVKAANLPFIPGVMTPGEAMQAQTMGFSLMKLFPATQAGGIGMLKAMQSPLPDVRFCPTGGVKPDNLQSFLSQPNVAMVGGSWLTPAETLAAEDWKQVTALAREAVSIANS
ncbi:bifunctional 4-hydroxy-2-oxoglutarate aldolase/2-dehydro-3-deoxy-phosphogluconate aldolase [Hydrogenophaga sp. 5NK40-0174]|uniref:bifunctional 4-hydroxy-2-oxoglutarate aldolase/2-dehydro-3-deoxy-phosphogluconate aldolase n=1 Tax=Hydrogenophaga sp. 5NK40-0174 TaxID=3127649 RepID=UPI0031096FA1